MVLAFIGGPLHLDRKQAPNLVRVFVHPVVTNGRDVVYHTYHALLVNRSGEMLYLYQGTGKAERLSA